MSCCNKSPGEGQKFYTFEEAAKKIEGGAEKLRCLISEGEVAAYREGDDMFLVRREIDALADLESGSDTSEIILDEITLNDE